MSHWSGWRPTLSWEWLLCRTKKQVVLFSTCMLNLCCSAFWEPSHRSGRRRKLALISRLQVSQISPAISVRGTPELHIWSQSPEEKCQTVHAGQRRTCSQLDFVLFHTLVWPVKYSTSNPSLQSIIYDRYQKYNKKGSSADTLRLETVIICSFAPSRGNTICAMIKKNDLPAK